MIINDLASRGKTESARYIAEKMDEDIKKCMADILLASNSKLLKKHGYFDLLGCDFMLTEDNHLYLLEINTNPALSLDNAVLEELLPGVVDGALELVLATQGPDVQDLSSPGPPETLPGQFQLVFDEAKKFVYGK
ncbi:hypothetical protein EON65_24950 [archaeon]|nr:MAG: hypothetical protein EON65_24950 [archaeon]